MHGQSDGKVGMDGKNGADGTAGRRTDGDREADLYTLGLPTLWVGTPRLQCKFKDHWMQGGHQLQEYNQRKHASTTSQVT